MTSNCAIRTLVALATILYVVLPAFEVRRSCPASCRCESEGVCRCGQKIAGDRTTKEKTESSESSSPCSCPRSRVRTKSTFFAVDVRENVALRKRLRSTNRERFWVDFNRLSVETAFVRRRNFDPPPTKRRVRRHLFLCVWRN